MADPGKAPLPPLFLDQTEARKAVKIFVWDWASPLIWGSGGLDDPAPFGSPPPPPPHYLKVWIRHCQWQVPLHTVSSQVHMEFIVKFEKKYFFLFFFFVSRFHFGMTDNAVWLVWLRICWGLISFLIQILFSSASHSLSYIIVPKKKNIWLEPRIK